MNKHLISPESIFSVLPEVLKGTRVGRNIGTVASNALHQRWEEIRTLAIYSRIDELDEGLLDILAKDFKVDWWDPSAPLEKKRQTMKNCWHVHRTLGTKAAVEAVLADGYPELHVEEWFEYDGEAMCFRIVSDDLTVLHRDLSAMIAMVDKVKRLSCHLEAVKVMHNTSMNLVVGVVDHLAMTITYGSSEREELFGELVDEKSVKLLDELGQQLFDG